MLMYKSIFYYIHISDDLVTWSFLPYLHSSLLHFEVTWYCEIFVNLGRYELFKSPFLTL